MPIGQSISSIGTREVRAFFGALELSGKKGWIDDVAMLFDSDQASETYKWLSAVPHVREWLGGRWSHGLTANGISIENKTFEGTLRFRSDDIRRDKLGQIQVRIAGLADQVIGNTLKLLSTLILNGTGDASGLCYDGQTFFDDDHSEGSSGTQKNLLVAGDVSQLDVSTPTAPTALEAANAVLGVIAHMIGYKDDQANYVNELASNFLIMTSPILGPAFSSAVTSKTLTGNVDNPLAQQVEYKVRHVINPRLSHTAAFLIFRTDGPGKAFIVQEEVPIEVQVIGAGSEHEILNNEQLFGVKSVGNVGYGLWQYAAHATMS